MTVTLRDVGVRYRDRVAVANVSLLLPPGVVTAIVGPNGSGKSSLLRAVAGVVAHDGVIEGDRSRIGHMPQDNAAPAALTAFEVVLLGRMRSLTPRVADADLHQAEAVMTELGIEDLAMRRITELSGGQRQMVFLAQVLAGDPGVLLLDEPTSALDIAHQLQVLGLVRDATRRRGLVTVVVLHDLNAAARHADAMALLHQGRLLRSGHPVDVLRPDVLAQAFGVEVAILSGPDGHPVVVPVAATPCAGSRTAAPSLSESR